MTRGYPHFYEMSKDNRPDIHRRAARIVNKVGMKDGHLQQKDERLQQRSYPDQAS